MCNAVLRACQGKHLLAEHEHELQARNSIYVVTIIFNLKFYKRMCCGELKRILECLSAL